MTFRVLVLTSTLLLAATQAARAQSVPADVPGPAPVATTGTVDVSRLPLDLRRIEREIRQATSREERDGLNLRYFVEVYAPAPPLVFLTKEDNLSTGPVPYGAPTHRDMLWMLTPLEHRGSLYALPLFRLPIGGDKKGK
jgi:hypothetical protein